MLRRTHTLRRISGRVRVRMCVRACVRASAAATSTGFPTADSQQRILTSFGAEMMLLFLFPPPRLWNCCVWLAGQHSCILMARVTNRRLYCWDE